MKTRTKRKTQPSVKNPILIDAVAMAKAHPATFSVPNTKSVKKGDSVKVAIEGTPGERFWVEVEHRTGDIFIGRIDNDLVTNTPLRCDDLIRFHARNIYMVYDGR